MFLAVTNPGCHPPSYRSKHTCVLEGNKSLRTVSLFSSTYPRSTVVDSTERCDVKDCSRQHCQRDVSTSLVELPLSSFFGTNVSTLSCFSCIYEFSYIKVPETRTVHTTETSCRPWWCRHLTSGTRDGPLPWTPRPLFERDKEQK